MKKQTESLLSTIVKQGVFTILTGGAITWAMFYLSALLIVKQTISQDLFFIFATLSICAGCAMSSLILALQRKSRGVFCGVLCFCVFAAVLLIGGYFCGVKTISSLMFLRLILLCMSACVGGYLGVKKFEKRVRRHHKR